MTRTLNEADAGAVPGQLRRLWPSDADGFAAHLKRLDAGARNARFGGSVTDDALVVHARLALTGGAIVYGHVEDDVLRAAGELHRIDGQRPAAAEAAFSVETAWQGRGIGSRLMRRVITAATARDIRRIIVVCQTSNRLMRRLADRFDASLEVLGGETIGRLETPAATPLSLLRAVGDGFDLAAANVEEQARRFLASLPDRAA
jgi:GNAT superfamily N-acetyltransferase